MCTCLHPKQDIAYTSIVGDGCSLTGPSERLHLQILVVRPALVLRLSQMHAARNCAMVSAH